MANRNKKKTREQENAGYLPHGWQEIHLWEVCENPVSGYSPVGADRPAGEDEAGVLKLNCIQENRFNPEKNKVVAASRRDELRTPVSKDTLLVSRSNTEDFVGAVCYVERDFPNLFLSDLLWRVSARDHDRVDLKWLAYLLSFAPYRAKILARANGTSETMKKITKDGFLSIRILFPGINEQKRIARILTTWDIAIDQIGALIAAKKQRKKAFTQQLLLGKERLPGFHKTKARKIYPFFDLPADWKCPQIGRIATEQSLRNKRCHGAAVLSCSKYKGFIDSALYFGKRAYSEDTSRYKVIRQGWFGYPSNHIEEGSIGLLADHEFGLVSPIYTVFECSANVVPEYLYAVFKTETFRHIFAVSTNRSVDRRGNLRWKTFATIRVPLPGIDEQQAIAAVLKTAEAEIAKLENKQEALKKQKRGLMQKLLTGEVRIKT